LFHQILEDCEARTSPFGGMRRGGLIGFKTELARGRLNARISERASAFRDFAESPFSESEAAQIEQYKERSTHLSPDNGTARADPTRDARTLI
jgi:hypothetical protein